MSDTPELEGPSAIEVDAFEAELAGQSTGTPPRALEHGQAPEPIRLGDRALFVGNTGKGKSEAALNLFAVHGGQRLLVDVQDHYAFGPDALAEEPPPLEVDDPRAIDWQHRTIRYVPNLGTRKEYEALYAAIYRRGDLLVICDEAEDVAPSAGGGSPPFVKKVTKQGRKRRITHAACSQRPAGVDRSIINQSEHAFVFPMIDPDDLQALSYRLGMSSRELSHHLNALGPFEYLRHTLGSERVLAMPALPPEALEFTRRHILNPEFTRR
jgi:hypothetical protein